MSDTSRQHTGTGGPHGSGSNSSPSKTTMETFSSDATQAMHDMGDAVSNAASSALEAGSEMASSATAQIKTFAGEIERMARNNPLGAVVGALIIGGADRNDGSGTKLEHVPMISTRPRPRSPSPGSRKREIRPLPDGER